MKQIMGYLLIAAPFLFIWLGVPALLADTYSTYWDNFKITSWSILFTGVVAVIIGLGVYLVTGSW